MKEIQGVLICLYKNKNDSHRFGVLKRTLNWEGWELVKGRIERNENPRETAIREIIEETGIKPEKVQELDETGIWKFEREGKKFKARYKGMMAKAPENARIDVTNNEVEEHSKGFFLNYRDSKDILTYDEHKKVLKKTKERLNRG